MDRLQVAGENGKANKLPGEIVIEKDTVFSADVKWFMAKVPHAIFGKDSQYKLKVRTQKVSAVQDYSDVDLDDGTCKQADIIRLLTDDEAKDVVGK